MLSPILFDYHVSTDKGKTAWLTKKKEFENICTISFINPPPPPPRLIQLIDLGQHVSVYEGRL